MNNAKDSNGKAKSFTEILKGMSAKKKASIIIIIVALICVFVLLNKFVFDPDIFPQASKINGIEVSGMTASQAEDKLTTEWNKRNIVITEDGNTIGSISNFNFEYSIDKQIQDCLKPGFFKGLLRSIDKNKRASVISMNVSNATGSFNNQFQALDIVKYGKGTVKTRNAYIDMSNTKFDIIHEVYGNNLNENMLKSSILKSIANGKTTFSYNPANYYTKPTVKSDDSELLEKQKYCKKNLTTIIKYNTALGTYVITPYYLDKMITVNDNGEITVHDNAVSNFVKDVLAQKCSTVGITRSFKSITGSVYTVSGGTYGYTLNTTKETTELISDLKSGKDVTRKPVYSSTGYGTPTAGNDIGNTYIEVNIGNQSMRCVVNGNTVLSTSVVTGNVSTSHSTPKGTYYILYKTTNVHLKGSNADGSKYNTKVKYWMPFYAGCGFHDAWWRSKFGGKIYISGGSHGCVNMPSSMAAKLYGYVSAGMPVVIHG